MIHHKNTTFRVRITSRLRAGRFDWKQQSCRVQHTYFLKLNSIFLTIPNNKSFYRRYDEEGLSAVIIVPNKKQPSYILTSYYLLLKIMESFAVDRS